MRQQLHEVSTLEAATYSLYFLFNDDLCFAASWPFPEGSKTLKTVRPYTQSPRTVTEEKQGV